MIETPWLFAIGMFFLCGRGPFDLPAPKSKPERWGYRLGHLIAIGTGMACIYWSIR